MRFRKRIAALLCAALVLNTVAPVAAAEVRGDIIDCVGDDYLDNAGTSIDSENVSFKEIDDVQEIMEIRNKVSENLKSMDHTCISWEEGVEFILLVDSTLSNNKYRLRSNFGAVSEDDYAYLVDSGKFKYSLVDVNGKKIKGLHKDDIWWRTYLYRPDKEELIKNPEQIPVNNGEIECKDENERYNRVITFARYDGKTSMSQMLITRPTKYFGRFVNHKYVTKATASCNYHVGEWIDVDNIQSFIGATSENAVFYMFKKKRISGNNIYSRWAAPETAAIWRSDNRPSDIYSKLRKGAYAIRVNKPKNYEAILNDFGSVTAFRPKKKGIYKVTYIVPDGYNKKFTVKVRVTD